MMKQELIDAAEASGLSRDAIGYLLTGEGESTARDCLSRSGLDDSAGPLTITNAHNASAASQDQTTNYSDEGIICCDSDSEEPYRKNILLKGKGPTTDCGQPDYPVSVSPLSSQGIFELQFSSRMQGPAKFNMLDNDIAFTDEPILAMPPRQSNRNFLEVYEVVFILDDREKFGGRSRKVADNIRSQIQVPVEVGRNQSYARSSSYPNFSLP